MTLKAGDIIVNADVQILKVKKGKATVIKIGDEEYVLRPKDMYQGGVKQHERNSKSN